MNKKKNIKKFELIFITLIITIFLCGCSEENSLNADIVHTEFLGTWSGNMEYTMFSFRENATNASFFNITELEFTKDILYMTITTDNGTMTMPNSYSVEGNDLILSSQFNGERPDGWQPPFDEENTPFEGEWPAEREPPFEGEWPSDREPPFNGERPSDGQRPSRTRSYTYRFEANYTILYLDESPFFKD